MREALAAAFCVALVAGLAHAEDGDWSTQGGVDRSSMSEPTPTGPSLNPVVIPYDTPLPVPDNTALTFLAEHPGELVHCNVVARITEFGELTDAFGIGCPNALRPTALSAVETWKFYPPTLADRAVPAQYPIQFVFVGNSVEVDTPIPDDAVLVRSRPLAVPQWPTPPKTSRKVRRWLEEQGLDGYRCVIDVEIDQGGLADNVLIVDCPGPLHEPVLKRLRRFGLTVDGARPGDGTVYRLDLWIPAENAPPPNP
ncbi:MAG: hypothetical protein H6739_26805 [Alphaproteobacteria bacterium]|nr:hypothetical protein [Alphaproteobacteria bacterium]